MILFWTEFLHLVRLTATFFLVNATILLDQYVVLVFLEKRWIIPFFTCLSDSISVPVLFGSGVTMCIEDEDVRTLPGEGVKVNHDVYEGKNSASAGVLNRYSDSRGIHFSKPAFQESGYYRITNNWKYRVSTGPLSSTKVPPSYFDRTPRKKSKVERFP